MRVCLTNMGCKLNQAESEGLARQFLAAGHRIVPDLASADLHVINSCTVTHAAAREARKLARRGRRVRAELKTVVTGCYASAEPQEAAGLAGVDLVVPNGEKDRLLAHVQAAFPEARPASPAELPVPYVPLPFGHARAMVKIGDGCNMRCAFCIIPFTRGGETSRELAEIVDEVAALARGGYREVVVTGVQISSYRRGGLGLYEVVAALLAETPVERLRLTSIAPWDFDERLLGLFADGRLCRHFHFSLQSGCDATLRRMRRPYTAAAFAALVNRVRAAIPGIAVTTDVIVGFPGESDEEHAASVAFVEACGFARCHVFPYSPRPGTAAATMPDPVPHPVLRRRMGAMLEAAAAGERRFCEEHLGASLEVLWENRRGERWQGLTDNYIRISAASERELAGSISAARLVAMTSAGAVAAEPL